MPCLGSNGVYTSAVQNGCFLELYKGENLSISFDTDTTILTTSTGGNIKLIVNYPSIIVILSDYDVQVMGFANKAEFIDFYNSIKASCSGGSVVPTTLNVIFEGTLDNGQVETVNVECPVLTLGSYYTVSVQTDLAELQANGIFVTWGVITDGYLTVNFDNQSDIDGVSVSPIVFKIYTQTNTVSGDLPLAGGTMLPGAVIGFANGSQLREGNTTGLQQVCSIGYISEWKAGRHIIYDNGGLIDQIFNNFVGPTINDASDQNYKINSLWYTRDGKIYKCLDSSNGAAVWQLTANESIPPKEEFIAKLIQIIDKDEMTVATGGTFIKGISYIPDIVGVGYDFSNVGGPIHPQPLLPFISTADEIPINWGGCTLRQQMWAPRCVGKFINTIDPNLHFTYSIQGIYYLNSPAGKFTQDNLFIPNQFMLSGVDGFIDKTIEVGRIDDYTLRIIVVTTSGEYLDNNMIIGDGNLYHFKIELNP